MLQPLHLYTATADDTKSSVPLNDSLVKLVFHFHDAAAANDCEVRRVEKVLPNGEVARSAVLATAEDQPSRRDQAPFHHHTSSGTGSNTYGSIT